MLFQEALGREDYFPGGILIKQTFGGMANWNPHVHALDTDSCWDRDGNVVPMPFMNYDDVHDDVSGSYS